jgi:hypothetical protein
MKSLEKRGCKMILELRILIVIVALILIVILYARAHTPKQDYGAAVQDCIDSTKIESNYKTQYTLEEMKFREKANDRRTTKTEENTYDSA